MSAITTIPRWEGPDGRDGSDNGFGQGPARDEMQLMAESDVMRRELPTVVVELRSVLGAKLVAYIAGVDSTGTISDWVDRTCVPTTETIETLRLTYRIVRRMEQISGGAAIASWFQGMNPLLEDRSPARVLRESVDHAGRAHVLAAAESWVGS